MHAKLPIMKGVNSFKAQLMIWTNNRYMYKENIQNSQSELPWPVLWN